ncbi:MAG: UDP-N-acetylmuramoyl-tripeptide--D-alanyl-D-alanine ligase [bacterium]
MKSDFIAKAVCGKLVNSTETIEITAISTDSREISKNFLFIPIKGETFDGHDFIEAAFSAGASLSISSKDIVLNKPYIKVRDTLQGLHALAKEYLKSIAPSRICITGSTGKTTTKNLLAASAPENNTVFTEGNTNNLIGVPQNIFRCGRNTKRLILEMGMNTAGELSMLSNTVRPTHIMVTTINNSHIGNFDSFERILDAKFEIMNGYESKDRPIIICGDDRRVLSRFSSVEKKTFGLNRENDFSPNSMTMLKDSSEIEIDSKKYRVRIPGMGGIYSFLAVYAFMKTFPDMEIDIEKGLEKFIEPLSRMNILPLKDMTLIDDSYNASPASMTNAIDVLSKFTARRVALLSDMLELGSTAPQMHREVGEELNKKSIDVLIAVGVLSKNLYDVFNGEKYYFEDRVQMEEKLFSILKKMDAVLVKGSHSTKMHETAKKIKEHYAV